MHVVANGRSIELAPEATIVDLLGVLGLGGRWVLVERNGEPIDRSRLATETLVDGDRLELVRAVAGGRA